MTEFNPDDYAVALSKYLGSRFHPELPHIGTLGTADIENTALSQLSAEAYAEETASWDEERKFSSFEFVPFSASYGMDLQGQKNNLVTTFSFYIRTNEGSWDDLKGIDNPGYQQDNPDNEREEGFWLTKDELKKSFRKFEIAISSDLETKKHNVTLTVDGSKVETEGNEKLKIQHDELENGFRIQVDLLDKSEPLVVRRDKKDYDITQQDYHVTFQKIIKINDDGTVVVDVKVNNKSTFTDTSTIPIIEKNSGNQYETKDEAIQRHRNLVFGQTDQEKEIYALWNPKLFSKKEEDWSVRGSLYGHLLEFSVTEDGIGSTNDPYKDERQVERITNLVYDERLDKHDGGFSGKIIYKNHIIFEEQIPPMTIGGKIDDVGSKIGLSKELSSILAKRFPDGLYKFQYDGISAINSAVEKDIDSAVLVSSRTGGGKTEAFLIPIIDYCISNLGVAGTKAIIFYPTKALSNDQTSRIISLLYDINKNLKAAGKTDKITVGLCHGDIPHSERDPKWQEYWDGGVPLKCPACKTGFLSAVEHTKVKCLGCQEELDFVILFRDPNFGILPDILVTNPDLIQWEMTERPDHHGIFGREIKCCKKCYNGWAKTPKAKCSPYGCQGTVFEKKQPFPPRFVVFDEVHQFKGTFGTNSLYLHERLRTMLKKYAKATHNIDWPVCSIGSSATIKNAAEFSETFFGLDQNDIKVVPKDDDERISYYDDAEYVKRTHLFVMPYRYRPASTTAKVVGYLQARRVEGTKPEPLSDTLTDTAEPLQILGFVNALQDLGLIVNSTRRERNYPVPVSFGGHSTHYNRKQRADVEKKFNRKQLNVIIATPTLEVGVDFETVNAVLIFGFPYSFNDYVQRIGRGGRGENTLVVTICQNWKPVDHYYLVDAKKKIAEQHASIEPIPITRDNREIIKRHLVSSFLDSISSLPDSPNLWENIQKDGKLAEAVVARGADMYDTNKEFSAINSLGLSEREKNYYQPEFKKIVESITDKLAGQIQPITKFQYLHGGDRSLDGRFKYSNLRDTEEKVSVEVNWQVFES